MKHHNSFVSVKARELGLTHLLLSRIVSRFMIFRVQENPFNRDVIPTLSALFMRGFIVSPYENVSTRVFSYFKELMNSVAFVDD